MGRARYRIGTGALKLALAQTQQVVDLLQSFDPEADFEIEIVSTHQKPPRRDETGARSTFAEELEHALLEKRVDIAVHAADKLSAENIAGLTVAAYTIRIDPREALISQHGEGFADLAKGSIVGTSSPLQRRQIANLRPDINFVDIAATLDQRIKKVRHGECHAAVVSIAGLIRLGLAKEAAHVLPLDLLLPAAGQGALALQCRHDDMNCFRLLELVNHEPTAWAVLAEREVVTHLQNDRPLSIGVCATFPHGYSQETARQMVLQAVAIDIDRDKIYRAQASGTPSKWHGLAVQVAEQLAELKNKDTG